MGNRIKHKRKNLSEEFKAKQKETIAPEIEAENVDKTTGGLLCTYNDEAVSLPKNSEDLEKFKEGAFKKTKQIKKTNIKFIF